MNQSDWRLYGTKIRELQNWASQTAKRRFAARIYARVLDRKRG
ncbi:hypothetical protein U91I_00964 [alpha proteobacterium U9-1i]|nr:hypothetical protein U91I_00964 [alpha proteobacterium U9-1i]